MMRGVRTVLASACLSAAAYSCSESEPIDGLDAGTQPVSGASASGGTGGGSYVGEDGLAGLEVTPASTEQLSRVADDQAALRVMLTDAPVAAERVVVEICGASVQRRATGDADDDAGTAEGAAGWLTLMAGCRELDLLTLRDGITSELGLEALTPGDYGQIRLRVQRASIQVAGELYPLTIPSGAQSGIKLIHRFSLSRGTLTTIALDFDAGESIHETGQHKYVMSPVIKVRGERRERMEQARERARMRAADDADGGVEHTPREAGRGGAAGERARGERERGRGVVGGTRG